MDEFEKEVALKALANMTSFFQNIGFLIEQNERLLKTIETARQMYASGTSADKCLEAIFRAERGL